MEKTLNKSLYYLILLTLYIAILFEEPIEKFFPGINYADEFAALLGFIFILLAILVNYYSKNETGFWGKYEKRVSVLLILLVTLGIMSNIFSGIHRTYKDILLDGFNLVKFWFVYCLGRICYPQSFTYSLKKTIFKINRFLIALSIICFFLNFLVPLGVSDIGEMRFGLTSYKFIFANSGSASNFFLLFLALLILDKENKHKKLYGASAIILVVSTLRFKALGVICFFLLFCFGKIFSEGKFGKLGNLIKVFFAGLAMVFVGWDQFSYYYFENTLTPRRMLLTYGIKTANRYFPLGSGFGTYGSSVAANDYSPLYYSYGFSKTWSLGQEGNYLNDNFWPMIIGQYGWIGGILYLFIFINIYKLLTFASRDCKEKYFASVLIFLDLIVASLGGPIMMGKFGAIFFLVISTMITGDN